MPPRALRRAGLTGAIVGAALAVAVTIGTRGAAGEAGPPTAPAASPSPLPPPIDGIACDQAEQQAVHLHVHLAVYADGVERPIPAGVGIVGPVTQPTSRGPVVVDGLCYYWLHTHTSDGIVHAEAPYPRSFTLGEFFDIWGRGLDPRHVGDDSGPVTAYLDGARFTADPRTLRLTDHAVIQLDVGADTAPRPYWFGFTPGSFLLAGAVAAGAVAFATLATTWSWLARLLVTSLAFVLVVSWRTACGLLGIDAAGPLGDVVVDGGSLVAGGLGAALLGARTGPGGGAARWLPAVSGALGAALAGAFIG